MRVYAGVFGMILADFYVSSRSSWHAQVSHDEGRLAWCEVLGPMVVSCPLQTLHEVIAALYPSHQMLYRRLGRALGEVHQRQFLLCTRARVIFF